MNTIHELFEEYDSDIICVTDFDILFRGARVDYLTRDENNKVHIWGGNPETDKHAEEFLPNKSEERLILEEILENM